MKNRIPVLILAAVCAGAVAGAPVPEPTLTVEQVKALLPEAAALSIKEFLDFSRGRDPAPRTLTTHPLTVEFLHTVAGNAEKQDFRFISDKPVQPAELAKALTRSEKKGYGSVIQPEDITDCTLKVDGDRATGVVSFRAKGLYEGTVGYTARRVEGMWRVVEFNLPKAEVKLTRGKDGTWKRTPPLPEPAKK
jgi:hypothetical protein